MSEESVAAPQMPRVAPSAGQHSMVATWGTHIYGQAVSQGWIDARDPEFAPGSSLRTALELMKELRLFTFDPTTDRFTPTDPAIASDLLVVPLARQGAEFLDASAQWGGTLSELAKLYRSAPTSGANSSVSELVGGEEINAFITSALNDCQTEVLFAQPYGMRSTAELATAESRDVAALKRGVAMRTLYQHAARESIATREYVADMTSLGACVRTSDEFFKRLMIFDHHTALIPASENHAAAVVIREPSVVDFLCDLFERAWGRALPYNVSDNKTAQAVADQVREMTLRMLLEGYSDAASAKRMGISPRTLSSYLAALKEEFGVQTRFQLGWQMARSMHLVTLPSD